MNMENSHESPRNLKKREKNFSDLEKNILTEICRRHPTIESKSYISSDLRLKKKAWREIQSEFAATFGGTIRTIETLQGCWKRIKLEKRRALGERRVYSRKTGEGHPLSPSEDYNEKTLSMLRDNVYPVKIELDLDPSSQTNTINDQAIYLAMETEEEIETNDFDLDQVVGKSVAISSPIFKESEFRKSPDIASSSKRKEKKQESNIDDSILPVSKQKSNLTLKELQVKTAELAMINEEDKSKLTKLKRKLIELQIKNEEEVYECNNYKLLLAKAQYEQFLKDNS